MKNKKRSCHQTSSFFYRLRLTSLSSALLLISCGGSEPLNNSLGEGEKSRPPSLFDFVLDAGGTNPGNGDNADMSKPNTVPPLYLPGTHDVFSQQLTIESTDTDIKPTAGKLYIPSDDNGETITTAPTSVGVFPAIVLLPGLGAKFEQYENYSKHLTSHGYIVLAINYADSKGSDGKHDIASRKIGNAITWLLSSDRAAFHHLISDAEHVGLLGHSVGGKLSFYTAAMEADANIHRIKAIAALDPSNSGGAHCYLSPTWCHAYPAAPHTKIDLDTGKVVASDSGLLDKLMGVPSLIFRAQSSISNPDKTNNASMFYYGIDNVGTFGVPGPALYIDVGDRGHTSFLYTDTNESGKLSKQTTTAWFNQYLKNANNESYFSGEYIQPYKNSKVIVHSEFRAAP